MPKNVGYYENSNRKIKNKIKNLPQKTFIGAK